MSESTADIKTMLQAQIGPLLNELLPDGYRAGGYWMAKNPTRNDHRAGSFWVLMTRNPGVWRDEATGETGDIFQLVQYLAGLADFKATMQWVKEFLRLGEMPGPDRERRLARARTLAAQGAQEMAARAVKMRKRAFACYIAGKKQPFSLSVADDYLNSRGIDLAKLGRVPGALGWLPKQRHAETDTHWPVMVAGFTGEDNKIVAVHRTFLALDGKGKAPISPARKIWPSFKGAAIRLWRGDSNLSVDQAAANGLRETLVIAEGVEDGLSIAMACPQWRVWCAGSLGNLAEITLPECIDEVVVCADNDWGKPQAQKLFDKGISTLSAQGVAVRVARSHVGKDANDALMGGAI